MAVYTYRVRGELVEVSVPTLVQAFARAIEHLRSAGGETGGPVPYSIAGNGEAFDQRTIYRVCRQAL